MASITAPTPDTLVTLKINSEGTNRRFKLPLRDLGASTLPDKLRFLLAIPPTSEAIFERYSDSAAAFIVLDSSNPSVYKQLYRAAKAKLKLRLKVTIKDKEPVTPKPATVEDEEPYPVCPVEQESGIIRSTVPAPPVPTCFKDSKQFCEVTEKRETSEKEITDSIADLKLTEKTFDGVTGDCRKVPASKVAFCNNTLLPAPCTPCGTFKRDPWFPEFERAKERRNAPKIATPLVSVFSVYCNNCNASIPEEHYHCSTCDDGDFDLCQSCVNAGVLCNGEDHWLIKRAVMSGKFVNSTTETIAPKKQFSESKTTLVSAEEEKVHIPTRTCNCCISELSEENFVTCTDCDDYDLCVQCHVALKHGHNPKHAFAFVDEDANHDPLAHALLAPGRNAAHAAICDGCDKYIFGVRHKCLDCPDWDYCDSCIANAGFIHADHRFVPLYETIRNVTARQQVAKAHHHGIFCDGPLCNADGNAMSAYISGDRYKCAVCHDTDFCASCEASPSNSHNKTHPLIKLRKPVRTVSVTTVGDHPNGKSIQIMGDRRPDLHISKSTETTPAQSTNAATQVQTVAEVKPTEAPKVEEQIKLEELPQQSIEAKVEEVAAEELPAPVEEELVAHFVRDAVADGTIMTPNSVFEQTWYLRNGGKTSWPAGCSVRFVGGDNMCAVDPDHPASVHELVSAAESTTCYTEVAPGQESGFTVLMRTPTRPGNFISYWRLTTPTGEKFGHRLWCDVTVNEPTPVVKEEPKVEVIEEEIKEETNIGDEAFAEETEDEVEAEGSQMIFPKLDNKSPVSSIHEETQAQEQVPASEEIFNDDFEDFTQNLEYDEIEDGFMTDDEYDILDASDEEYLAEQKRAFKK